MTFLDPLLAEVPNSNEVLSHFGPKPLKRGPGREAENDPFLGQKQGVSPDQAGVYVDSWVISRYGWEGQNDPK